MRKSRNNRRTRALATPFAWLVVAFLLASGFIRADTIFLKNGRSIIAGQVSEEGDQVFYDGENGRVSLPKSLVERVQKDDAVPTPASNGVPVPPIDAVPTHAPRPSAADSPVANFAKAMSVQIQLSLKDANGVVRDGAVDEERLNLLAGMAGKGDLELQSAVNAYLVAAVFEAREQHVAQASRWAEEALRLSGQDWNALLVAAQLDLERQQYTEALNHLFLAQSLKPDSPEVLKQLGFAYYFLEGPEKANRYWKQSYSLHPDPRLQELIQQTEKEAQIEGGFIQAQSSHFVLNREGAEISESFSRQILETLERHYSDLEAALDFSPREPMVVILYTAQEFADLTRAPGWAGALNDGKIRVPVQGLTSMTPKLSGVLKHEMVHSFVHGLVQANCPTWFNEGLAQVESGQSPAIPPAVLAKIYAQSMQIPLEQLEGSFMQFSSDVAAVAYAESQAAVAMIRDQHGAYELAELLKALARGQTMAQALRRTLGTDYTEFQADLARYLASR